MAMTANGTETYDAALRSLDIEPISDYIGAEIRGVDLGQQTPELHEALKVALAKYGVIFLRGQDITPEQHAELAYGFGNPFDRTDPSTATHGYSFMGTVSKTEDQVDNIGNAWHIDQTYQVNPPNATILIAREIPIRGGDTLFAGMAACYEALSPGLQAMLDGMKAVHSNARVVARSKRLAGRSAMPDVVHPCVIRNPITGRKSLYITAGYTQRFEGWTEAESRGILDYLLVFGQRPEFQVRFKWEVGSIAIWDNTQVWHYATNDYHGRRRVMDRITVSSFSIAEAGVAK
jgi:taurine dioxygenase